ncbi:cupin domain-containing protein [Pseudomonas sp. C11]|uniref:(R)-mandelonitrile lyase n=1 Tax=Pseudomonas sp. C11 TaxID=3075550 RepID=UPI002AFE1978|nr:cupin domain-containing protein [Pseudomonas sp. C11]
MKTLLASAALACATTLPAYAETIEIAASGVNPTRAGNPAQFTGQVLVDALTTPSSAEFAGSGLVSFAPGARTAWHTHPAGQWLYVTVGSGWVQQEGQPVREIKSGDAVWIPAGVKHWHGATDQNTMSHVAVTPFHEGKNVEWLEQVSDAIYLKR